MNSSAFSLPLLGAAFRPGLAQGSGKALCRKIQTPEPSSVSFNRLGTGRISSGQGPSDSAFRTVGHRYAVHFRVPSKTTTRTRRTNHSNSVVGAPSGAMLFCTFRNSTSSSLRRQGPSDLALRKVSYRFAAHPWRRNKAFTRLRRASYFSLLGQREVTKRKTTPKRWSPGILPCDCAAGLRGFADSTSVCWQRTGRDPSRPPCGPFLRPAATAYGARLARILRARARSKSNSQSPSSAFGTFSREREKEEQSPPSARK